MLPIPALTPLKLYIIAGALVALIVGEFFFVRDIYVTACDAKVLKIKSDHDEAIKKFKDEVRVKENKLGEVKHELEVQNVESKKKISETHTYYTNRIARDGLRDPGRKTPATGLPADPVVPGCPERPKCDTRLSEEASGFLLTLTREADEMKSDYATCYSWMTKVKQVLQAKP